MDMTGEEAVAYIESYTWSATRLGLERTRELLARLGDPQKELKFVHVAGSNGKGSTSAMLASVLEEAGYVTGLYVSPHLERFQERIRVNGVLISLYELGEVTQEVRAAAEAMADHPSQFELSTAIAMMYFRRRRCDIVVLEVGMGGELDSTNVIDPPEVAVLTNIGLEHTEYLGATLPEIARAKGGIIKTGSAAVLYPGEEEVRETVERICRERAVPLREADLSSLIPVSHSLKGQTFFWRGEAFVLPLLGAHQLRNAAVALTALEVLGDRGWSIPKEAVAVGLARVSWPARFEVLRREPLFILDGGHNPQCAQALGENLRDYLPGQRFTVLLGTLGDKDWRRVVELIVPFARDFLCVAPPSPRALPAKELAGYIREVHGLPARACRSPGAAARTVRGPALAFGSLYMAADIRRAVLGR